MAIVFQSLKHHVKLGIQLQITVINALVNLAVISKKMKLVSGDQGHLESKVRRLERVYDSTKYISTSPLFFAGIFPRGVQLNLSLISAYVLPEILILPASPCCSMRAAMFTASPHIS